MKRTFRTILIVLLLTIAFVFYMKWFNTPLAETTSNFIFKTVECDYGLSGEVLDENEVLMKLENLEEHMNTLEDLIELQNSATTPNQFEVSAPAEIEPTEDELFEEFKTWRSENHDGAGNSVEK